MKSKREIEASVAKWKAIKEAISAEAEKLKQEKEKAKSEET